MSDAQWNEGKISEVLWRKADVRLELLPTEMISRGRRWVMEGFQACRDGGKRYFIWRTFAYFMRRCEACSAGFEFDG